MYLNIEELSKLRKDNTFDGLMTSLISKIEMQSEWFSLLQHIDNDQPIYNPTLQISYNRIFNYDYTVNKAFVNNGGLNHPGVYILASKENNPDDLWCNTIYIGRYNASGGVRERVGIQFIQGLNIGHGHPASNRLHIMFYLDMLNGLNLPLGKLNGKKLKKLNQESIELRQDSLLRNLSYDDLLDSFRIKYLTFPSINQTDDIKIGGIVRSLEYYLFADYYAKYSQRPVLNKQ